MTTTTDVCPDGPWRPCEPVAPREGVGLPDFYAFCDQWAAAGYGRVSPVDRGYVEPGWTLPPPLKDTP